MTTVKSAPPPTSIDLATFGIEIASHRGNWGSAGSSRPSPAFTLRLGRSASSGWRREVPAGRRRAVGVPDPGRHTNPAIFAAAPPLSDVAVPDVDDTCNHIGAVVFQISTRPGAAGLLVVPGWRMDRAVQIRLFGAFAVRVGEEVVPEGAWRLRKAKSLVKLLALAPERRVHRERATELLWPERAPEAAANNFHQALYVARRALEAAGAEASAVLPLRDDMLALYPGGRGGGRRRRLRGGGRPRPRNRRAVGLPRGARALTAASCSPRIATKRGRPAGGRR